jgi:alpha-methylacyl-CoA racemase
MTVGGVRQEEPAQVAPGRPGPLTGLRVLELGGIGPAPFAGMTLADMGADVVRIDRPGGEQLSAGPPQAELLNRGKRSAVLDLKTPDGVQTALALAGRADALLEGWRPGVAERLGVGPAECQARNAALVYGRMTGWGQTGPLARSAGHDLSYIARTGALHAIGAAGGPPQIPLNLVGDFGGGATYLVMGVLAGVLEARASGVGRVVDASIVDGVAHLMTGAHSLLAAGQWRDERGVNMLDGGAPFYRVYEAADGRHVAVGAIEARFYAEFLRVLGLDLPVAAQQDRATWPLTAAAIARRFKERTQRQWMTAFAGTDSCVAPVLSVREAAGDVHLQARGTLVEQDGYLQAAPAPRFGGTPPVVRRPPQRLGAHTEEVLDEWGAR